MPEFSLQDALYRPHSLAFEQVTFMQVLRNHLLEHPIFDQRERVGEAAQYHRIRAGDIAQAVEELRGRKERRDLPNNIESAIEHLQTVAYFNGGRLPDNVRLVWSRSTCGFLVGALNEPGNTLDREMTLAGLLNDFADLDSADRIFFEEARLGRAKRIADTYRLGYDTERPAGRDVVTAINVLRNVNQLSPDHSTDIPARAISHWLDDPDGYESAPIMQAIGISDFGRPFWHAFALKLARTSPKEVYRVFASAECVADWPAPEPHIAVSLAAVAGMREQDYARRSRLAQISQMNRAAGFSVLKIAEHDLDELVRREMKTGNQESVQALLDAFVVVRGKCRAFKDLPPDYGPLPLAVNLAAGRRVKQLLDVGSFLAAYNFAAGMVVKPETLPMQRFVDSAKIRRSALLDKEPGLGMRDRLNSLRVFLTNLHMLYEATDGRSGYGLLEECAQTAQDAIHNVPSWTPKHTLLLLHLGQATELARRNGYEVDQTLQGYLRSLGEAFDKEHSLPFDGSYSFREITPALRSAKSHIFPDTARM